MPPSLFQALKSAVLAEAPKRTIGLTTALRGAGGYGKTTLANALCRDDDVRFAFSDGILRVEIGKDRLDVTGLILDLIEKLDPEGKRPALPMSSLPPSIWANCSANPASCW